MLQSSGFAFEYRINKHWSGANESLRVSNIYGEIKDNSDIEAKIPLNRVSQVYRLIAECCPEKYDKPSIL